MTVSSEVEFAAGDGWPIRALLRVPEAADRAGGVAGVVAVPGSRHERDAWTQVGMALRGGRRCACCSSTSAAEAPAPTALHGRRWVPPNVAVWRSTWRPRSIISPVPRASIPAASACSSSRTPPSSRWKRSRGDARVAALAVLSARRSRPHACRRRAAPRAGVRTGLGRGPRRPASHGRRLPRGSERSQPARCLSRIGSRHHDGVRAPVRAARRAATRRTPERVVCGSAQDRRGVRSRWRLVATVAPQRGSSRRGHA